MISRAITAAAVLVAVPLLLVGCAASGPKPAAAECPDGIAAALTKASKGATVTEIPIAKYAGPKSYPKLVDDQKASCAFEVTNGTDKVTEAIFAGQDEKFVASLADKLEKAGYVGSKENVAAGGIWFKSEIDPGVQIAYSAPGGMAIAPGIDIPKGYVLVI